MRGFDTHRTLLASYISAGLEARGFTIMSKRRNPNVGSTLNDFLTEEGILEELQIQAIKEVVAWQLEEAMKKMRVSKASLARMLRTSRTQINRLLDPANDITLSGLQRAAALIGRHVKSDWSSSGKHSENAKC